MVNLTYRMCGVLRWKSTTLQIYFASLAPRFMPLFTNPEKHQAKLEWLIFFLKYRFETFPMKIIFLKSSQTTLAKSLKLPIVSFPVALGRNS